jgi:hypothetical protein
MDIEAELKSLAEKSKMTVAEVRAGAKIALAEAGHWYGMVERYVYATPALPEMNARPKYLQDLAGPVEYIGCAVKLDPEELEKLKMRIGQRPALEIT